MKELADDNFKFDENGRNFFKQVENTVGKGEIAHYEPFLLFPKRLVQQGLLIICFTAIMDKFGH